jgi:Ca-activated chloride channel homolog
MSLTHRLPALLAALGLFAVAAAASPVRAAEAKQPALLVVLDASGSMLEQVAGATKLSVVRGALDALLEGLPDSSEAGVIAYGHRSPDKCDDVELLVPLAPLAKGAFAAKLAGLAPQGSKTPLTAATRRAIELAKRRAAPTTVVLISDGLESCGGSLCDVIEKARAANAELTLHVIGFDLKGADSEPLRCAAQAGGGRYFDVGNAPQLRSALDHGAAALRVPTGVLSVSATLAGKPIEADAEVRRKGSKPFFGRKQVNLGGADKPVIFRLPGGAYDLRVTPRERGVAAFEARAIELVPGRQAAQQATFGPGKLSLSVTHNGAALRKAPDVRLKRAGEPKALAVSRRTLRQTASKPDQGLFELELTAGTYDIEVGTSEIIGAAQRSLRAIVEAGKTARASCDFESGKVTLGAKNGGQLVGATIEIRSAGKRAASGASSHAVPEQSFVLAPGQYEVQLAAPKLRLHKRFEVALRPGEEVRQIVELE